MKLTTLLAALGFTALIGNAGASLLSNGDFEAGSTLPANGWQTDYDTITVTGLAGNYAIATEIPSWAPGFGDHTTGSTNMAVFNGSANDSDRLLAQDVAITNGLEYVFSGWVANLTEDAAPGVPPVLELRVDGNSVAAPVVGPTVDDTWIPFSFVWTADATGTFSVALHDLETAGFGNDFALDDLSMTTTAVPEASEAALALLGIPALLLYRRPRRRLSAR